MKKIDLHMHTNISADGTFTPEELVKIAELEHMDVISVCDHNSVRAVASVMEEGKRKGIQVIPGIEIDCMFDGVNVHMTGYGMDVSDARYEELEKFYVEQYLESTWTGARNFLQSVSLELSDDVLASIAVRGMIISEDLAEYLLTHEAYDHLEWLKPYRPGGSRSVNPNLNFYWDYFSQGKPGYVEGKKKTAQEAIELIHSTGGKAVIAHPGANFKGQDEVLGCLMDLVDGVEVFSSYHSTEEVEYYKCMALEHNCFLTAGSDFHGHHKPSIVMGNMPGLDESAYPELMKTLKQIGDR